MDGATTGRAHSMTSTIARGSPSKRDGMTSTWLAVQISFARARGLCGGAGCRPAP
jgi:hypothetical protein